MVRIKGVDMGEDVPIIITSTDPDTGDAVDPDAAPTVTITAPDDTDVVSAASMTSSDVGVYEYVWDTATDASGTGNYTISVMAEFSSETKIEKVGMGVN